MKEYIDKSALVKMIKHHIKEEPYSYFCKCLLSEIDTLEVKEVNLVGWWDYYKTEDCKEMLKELQETYNKNDGEPWLEGTFISHRNRIDLNIVNKFYK